MRIIRVCGSRVTPESCSRREAVMNTYGAGYIIATRNGFLKNSTWHTCFVLNFNIWPNVTVFRPNESVIKKPIKLTLIRTSTLCTTNRLNTDYLL